MRDKLFHGFPRTPEGRKAAREWLSSGIPHEEALRSFERSLSPLTRSYRGKPNKYGVRGLSYSSKESLWTGEFYERGKRLTKRSKDRLTVEMWLLSKHSHDGA